MDRYEPLCPLLYGKLKSKRRRKRLQKEGLEKKLMALHREERKLRHDKWLQEPIPLDKPIRKGWKRFFVMRDDLRNRPDTAFFETLLEKINTVEYSRNKKFAYHKRRVKKYRYAMHTQKLKYITEWNFQHATKCPLSEKEKEYFIPEYGCGNKTLYVKHYIFNQPWRYVLTIKPHWITHAKVLDEERERRSDEIDRYLTTNHLRHKMTKLIDGWVQYRRWRYEEPPKFSNPFYNKPFTHFLEMYEEEQEFLAQQGHCKTNRHETDSTH